MARYYSEDDIKEVLKTLVRESRYQHDGEDYYAGVSQVAGEILTLQPADVAPKNVWINVDERLPMYGELVLVSSMDKITKKHGWFYLASYDKERKWWNGASFGRVTHWMPLPEPPEMN